MNALSKYSGSYVDTIYTVYRATDVVKFGVAVRVSPLNISALTKRFSLFSI